jgi:hypothetical protein
MPAHPPNVRFLGDCVAKLFSRPKRAILIQGQAQTRIIDSKHRSIGFDYCVFAVQQRVLQHNNRHKADNPIALAFVRFWTKADNGGFWPVCPLLTQQRHWLCTAAMVLMPVSAPIEVLV